MKKNKCDKSLQQPEQPHRKYERPLTLAPLSFIDAVKKIAKAKPAPRKPKPKPS